MKTPARSRVGTKWCAASCADADRMKGAALANFPAGPTYLGPLQEAHCRVSQPAAEFKPPVGPPCGVDVSGALEHQPKARSAKLATTAKNLTRFAGISGVRKRSPVIAAVIA